MRDLNELAQEIHDNAVAHGWWDKESHEVEVNGCGIGVSTEPSDRNPFEVLALSCFGHRGCRRRPRLCRGARPRPPANGCHPFEMKMAI